MVRKRKLDKAPKIAVLAVVVGLLASIGISSPSTMAITPLPEPDPKPGGFGIEATKSQPAPTQGATITTPVAAVRSRLRPSLLVVFAQKG